MPRIRTLTNNDKLLIAVELLNAGIKARIRKFPGALRIVFAGDWETVATVLNNNGYCFHGMPFTRTTFNSIDRDHGEIFVRHATA